MFETVLWVEYARTNCERVILHVYRAILKQGAPLTRFQSRSVTIYRKNLSLGMVSSAVSFPFIEVFVYMYMSTELFNMIWLNFSLKILAKKWKRQKGR